MKDEEKEGVVYESGMMSYLIVLHVYIYIYYM